MAGCADLFLRRIPPNTLPPHNTKLQTSPQTGKEADMFHTSDPLRIAVLLGGDSTEREISLRSGQAVLAALQAAGHAVVAVDPRDVSLLRFD